MTSSSSTTPNKSGTTLQADIRSLLNNEEITDIILVPTPTNPSSSTSSSSHHDHNNSSSNRDDTYIGTVHSEEGVPAIKSILAARSPVFRRMLYGDFRETKQQQCSSDNEENVLRVTLNYSESVLRLLVEFCFTDRLDSLEGGSSSSQDDDTIDGGNENEGSQEEDNCSSSDSRVTDDCDKKDKHEYEEESSPPSLARTARLLTSLSSAAHYFDIPKLEHDILSRLNEIMTQHPSLACVVLDQGSQIMQEDLCQVALERILARPKAALLPYDNTIYGCCSSSMTHDTNIMDSITQDKGGVEALSASLLERVVFDEKSTASELTKFTCLQRWVERCPHDVVQDDEALLTRESPSDEEDGEAHTSSSSSPAKSTGNQNVTTKSHHEQKRSIAAHLAQKLDLSLIPASDLDTVSNSNLLSKDDLFKAYRLQALNAERTKSKVFVEGAGLPEVNGTYIQGGVHEGIPMYNKEGVWRDREEVFRIFLCTYSNGNKSWCISIVPKGKEPGKTTDVDFYECPVTYGNKGGGVGPYAGMSENGLGIVPSRGWKLVNFGQPPTPKCSLIAGVSSD